MSPDEEIEAFSEVLDRHYPAEDWKCSCGEDLYGATAAYSWALYREHTAVKLHAALIAARELNDNGNRTSLDDAITALGFDRAELEAEIAAEEDE